MDVNEWMSYECLGCMYPHVNIHNSFTSIRRQKSHLKSQQKCKCKRALRALPAAPESKWRRFDAAGGRRTNKCIKIHTRNFCLQNPCNLYLSSLSDAGNRSLKTIKTQHFRWEHLSCVYWPRS